MMGLEVFYKQDVENALLAAEQATNAATQAMGGEGDPFAAGYLAGNQAALTTLALAFGLGGGDDRAGLPSLIRGNERMLALMHGR